MIGLQFGHIDGKILQARIDEDGNLRACLFPHKEVMYLNDINALLDTKVDYNTPLFRACYNLGQFWNYNFF